MAAPETLTAFVTGPSARSRLSRLPRVCTASCLYSQLTIHVRLYCTGGASGIGLGIVRTLLSSPSPRYNLVLADLSSSSFPPVLGALAAEFGAADVRQRVECVEADVTRYDALSAAFEKARRKREGWSGRVDVVCAIAGISQVRYSRPPCRGVLFRDAQT